MTNNPYFTEYAVSARRDTLRAEAERSRQYRAVRGVGAGKVPDPKPPLRRLARLRIRWAG